MVGVKVCPNCGSSDVSRDSVGVAAMMGLDYGYRCGNCGYAAKVMPEVDPDELESFQEEFEEKNPDDFLDADTKTPEAPDGPGMFVGIMFVLLGLGSVPIAFDASIGIAGSLLLPAGLYIIYKDKFM
ncbi:MAG: TFIIB-type zinc ribbon-containing protein [Candidatus Nanohaloarchaeota archaeon QJJ-5]|nr:TFIIB-type zinc ribbon-containing protein [Candidatus Nanohaloarchaeota archaeon QJJ-5]